MLDGLVEFPYGHGSASRCGRMGVENHRITGGDDVDDITCKSRNGVGRWGDGPNDTERGVFFEGDAMIPTTPVGTDPVDARHQADDLELTDLVIQTADLGFFELYFTPLVGSILAHGFDNALYLPSGFNSLFL